MAALADAELSLEKRDLEPPQEPDPTPVEPIGDVADHDETPEEIWEKEVQKRARTFQIETVEHVLRPMTRMPDEPEPQVDICTTSPASPGTKSSRSTSTSNPLAPSGDRRISVERNPSGRNLASVKAGQPSRWCNPQRSVSRRQRAPAPLRRSLGRSAPRGGKPTAPTTIRR